MKKALLVVASAVVGAAAVLIPSRITTKAVANPAAAPAAVALPAQGQKQEPYFHIRAAIGHFEAAKAELDEDSYHYAGNRVKAIQLANQAIIALRDGIRYAEKQKK
jgi:hypothetical protein